MFEQQLLEVAVLREPVVAARGGDDVAAVGDDLRSGRHALHGLIQVLIERVTAVGRHDDRQRAIAGTIAVSREKAQPAVMSGGDVAAEHGGDLAAPIQRDVDAEVHRDQGAVVADALLGRIAVEQTPRRARVADHARVVIPHDRRDVGDSGKDPLVAAGESRHEVRLDEPEHDPPIGLDVGAVEEHLVTVLADAGARQLRRIEARHG